MVEKRPVTSIFQVSLEAANQLYIWGWRASVFGSAITAISLVFLFIGTRIRDRDFELKVATTSLAAANANERAALLEKEAASLRLELEQVRIKQMPRTITPEQESVFINLLRQSSPKGPITVICLSDDQEANRFAKRIREVLDRAGYGNSITRGVKNIFGPILNTGKNNDDIAICYGPNRRGTYGTNVQNAFGKIGIHLNGVEVDPKALGLSPDEFAVVVIRKSL